MSYLPTLSTKITLTYLIARNFFFFDMSTQEGEGVIRTKDLNFIMRGPS
jgi:hypothetical protein